MPKSSAHIAYGGLGKVLYEAVGGDDWLALREDERAVFNAGAEAVARAVLPSGGEVSEPALVRYFLAAERWAVTLKADGATNERTMAAGTEWAAATQAVCVSHPELARKYAAMWNLPSEATG